MNNNSNNKSEKIIMRVKKQTLSVLDHTTDDIDETDEQYLRNMIDQIKKDITYLNCNLKDIEDDIQDVKKFETKGTSYHICDNHQRRSIQNKSIQPIVVVSSIKKRT